MWAGYRVPGAYSLRLSFMRELKGQNTLDTPYAEGRDATSLVAPSGIVETKNVVHAGAGADPLPYMSLWLDLYFIFTQNFDNVHVDNVTDFQIVTTVKLRI